MQKFTEFQIEILSLVAMNYTFSSVNMAAWAKLIVAFLIDQKSSFQWSPWWTIMTFLSRQVEMGVGSVNMLGWGGTFALDCRLFKPSPFCFFLVMFEANLLNHSELVFFTKINSLSVTVKLIRLQVALKPLSCCPLFLFFLPLIVPRKQNLLFRYLFFSSFHLRTIRSLQEQTGHEKRERDSKREREREREIWWERDSESERAASFRYDDAKSWEISYAFSLCLSRTLTTSYSPSLSLPFLLSHVHTHHLSPPFSWLDKVSYWTW